VRKKIAAAVLLALAAFAFVAVRQGRDAGDTSTASEAEVLVVGGQPPEPEPENAVGFVLVNSLALLDMRGEPYGDMFHFAFGCPRCGEEALTWRVAAKPCEWKVVADNGDVLLSSEDYPAWYLPGPGEAKWYWSPTQWGRSILNTYIGEERIGAGYVVSYLFPDFQFGEGMTFKAKHEFSVPENIADNVTIRNLWSSLLYTPFIRVPPENAIARFHWETYLYRMADDGIVLIEGACGDKVYDHEGVILRENKEEFHDVPVEAVAW